MARVQALVVRNERVLMVKHRQDGVEYWCVPGGGLERGETPEQGALRELHEECLVTGKIVRKTSHWYEEGNETITFLMDIDDQNPALGHDPELTGGKEILVDVKWLKLSEVPERDRAFLWAAGLIGVGSFFPQIDKWGNKLSYPGLEEQLT